MRRLSILVVLIAIFFGGNQPDYVSAQETGVLHAVQPAETLLDLQLFYGLSAEQIAEANALNGTVGADDELTMPVILTTASLPTELAPFSYIVQRGDTLFRIATRFNVPMENIAAANEIVWHDRIYVGQELLIPGSDYQPPTQEEILAHTEAPLAPELIPAPTILEGKQVVVVLSQQRTYAFENGVLLRHFVVSTGLPATPTVRGDFKVYLKYDAQRMTGPGYDLPGVPWVMYFYQGYALHGTYWHNNFGNPMSHGCVNLRTPEAEWLYQWTEIGTHVRVVW